MASSGDRDGIDAAIEVAALLAQEIGQPYLSWQVLYLRCLLVLLSGDAEEADRLATEALEVGIESGQPDAFVVYGASLANIRFHQDRLGEILPLLGQAAADNPGLPGFQAAHAMALCECGQLDRAGLIFQAAVEADFHASSYDYVWLTTTTLWADTAAWLGDTAAAALLYERLSPYENQGVSSGATFNGTVGVFLARLAIVLGRHDDGHGPPAAGRRSAPRHGCAVLASPQPHRMGAPAQHAWPGSEPSPDERAAR